MPKPRHKLSKADVKRLFGVEVVEPRWAEPKRLGASEFEAYFGIRPAPKLGGRQKRAAKKADELFGDMWRVYGISSLDVFRGAAEELHARVLHELSSCPQFVLHYMAQQLSPERVETHRTKQAERLKAGIARQEAALRRLI